jgi:hypothetical protein
MELKTLKEHIYNLLLAASNLTVYSVKAPTNATYPCCIYAFTSIIDKTDMQDKRILEIDYWDDTGNDDTILTASNAVREALDYYWDSSLIRAFLDWESEIPDPERNITRISQRYLVKGW